MTGDLEDRVLTSKSTHTKLCHLLGVLRNAELCVSSQKLGRSANPRRRLQPHDIELQRAPVIS